VYAHESLITFTRGVKLAAIHCFFRSSDSCSVYRLAAYALRVYNVPTRFCWHAARCTRNHATCWAETCQTKLLITSAVFTRKVYFPKDSTVATLTMAVS